MIVHKTKKIGKVRVYIIEYTDEELENKRFVITPLKFWVVTQKRITDRKPYGKPHKWFHMRGKDFADLKMAKRDFKQEVNRRKILLAARGSQHAH